MLPVICLKASSSEGEVSGEESKKEEEVDNKELRMLRLFEIGITHQN